MFWLPFIPKSMIRIRKRFLKYLHWKSRRERQEINLFCCSSAAASAWKTKRQFAREEVPNSTFISRIPRRRDINLSMWNLLLTTGTLIANRNQGSNCSLSSVGENFILGPTTAQDSYWKLISRLLLTPENLIRVTQSHDRCGPLKLIDVSRN